MYASFPNAVITGDPHLGIHFFEWFESVKVRFTIRPEEVSEIVKLAPGDVSHLCCPKGHLAIGGIKLVLPGDGSVIRMWCAHGQVWDKKDGT